MISGIKSILVGVTYEPAVEEVSQAFPYALSLAKEARAQLSVHASSVQVGGTGIATSRMALQMAATENKRLKELVTAAAENARGEASRAGVSCAVETSNLRYVDLVEKFATQARVHDITILDAAAKTASADRGFIETALFETGRPAIIVPPGVLAFQGSRIAVAWDGGGRAARALHDAIPLLAAATHVEILSVSEQKDRASPTAGTEAAKHLAAHGIDAIAADVTASDGDVARALRERIETSQIDLLVMGAYAHAWIRQIVLGGVTQSLLKSSPVPLFMSY